MRFLLLLFFVATLSARDWVEVTSPHFTVLTDDGVAAGQRVARRFEQVRRVFEETFPAGRLDPGRPFVIIAGKNGKSLRDFVPQFRNVRGNKRIAGFFVSTEARCFVILDLQNPGFNVLTHEYVHLLNNINYAYLPLWLNEGLAEFYETMEVRANHVRIGDVHPHHLATLNRAELLPIDTFLEADHDSPYYNESRRANVFYAQAWALTHYLLTDRAARKRLGAFLSALGRGLPVNLAATQSLGSRAQLERELSEYASRRSFYYLKIEAAVKNKREKYPSRTLDKAEVLAWKGVYMVSSQPLASPDFLEESLAMNPDGALAHEGLGYYWYRSGNKRRALEAFAGALAQDAPLAHFFTARIMADKHDLKREQTQPIIDHYEKTIALAPEFSPAYADLGFLYSRFEDTRKWSILLIDQAIARDNGNMSNRFLKVHALANAERFDEAIALLQRMNHMAVDRRQRDRISRLLESMATRAAAKK